MGFSYAVSICDLGTLQEVTDLSVSCWGRTPQEELLLRDKVDVRGLTYLGSSSIHH